MFDFGNLFLAAALESLFSEQDARYKPHQRHQTRRQFLARIVDANSWLRED